VVAFIDRSESRNVECVQWLKNFLGRLYSTEAVLTEALYILNFSTKTQCAAIDFVLNAVVDIVPLSIDSLKKAKNLMEKYADLPMDYVDASIVCLAT
jgi:predicted nucleic acid-binding protein